MLKFLSITFEGQSQPYHYAVVKDSVLRTACGSMIPRSRGIELKREGAISVQDAPFKHDVCRACARSAGTWIKKAMGVKPKNWVAPPKVDKASTEVDHEYFDDSETDNGFQLESPIYRSAKLTTTVAAKPAPVQRGNKVPRAYSPG